MAVKDVEQILEKANRIGCELEEYRENYVSKYTNPQLEAIVANLTRFLHSVMDILDEYGKMTMEPSELQKRNEIQRKNYLEDLTAKERELVKRGQEINDLKAKLAAAQELNNEIRGECNNHVSALRQLLKESDKSTSAMRRAVSASDSTRDSLQDMLAKLDELEFVCRKHHEYKISAKRPPIAEALASLMSARDKLAKLEPEIVESHSQLSFHLLKLAKIVREKRVQQPQRKRFNDPSKR